jgi:GDP-L-fucose synthase
MKILITGSSGMAGKSLLEHPEIISHEVISPPRQLLDLSNFEKVKTYLRQELPDFIIHCAGQVGGIQANINAPVEFLINNLEMGKNLILAAQQIGIPRLINFGSSCMYPKDINEAISEDKLMTGILEPTNEGYALAKIIVAKLCDYISQNHTQLSYKTIIPCNLYGKYDKFNPEDAHLIPAMILKIHSAMENNDASVEIWGDGKARREFMYSGDLADFIAYSLDRFDDMPTPLNVGVGYDYTVNEYYKEAAKVIGYQGSFTHNTNRAAGMQRKLTDITKLTNFGWRSKTKLNSGIIKTYQYFKKEIACV